MAWLDLDMLLSLLNAAECEVCIMQHLILGSELHQYPHVEKGGGYCKVY